MNRFNISFCLVLFYLVLASCSQTSQFEKTSNRDFVEVGKETVDELNTINAEFQIFSMYEIVSSYRPKDEFAEGDYNYIISEPIVEDNLTQVTLTETGLNDDSLFGIRMVFLLQKIEAGYSILSINEQYKCWKNRGSQDWNSNYCI